MLLGPPCVYLCRQVDSESDHPPDTTTTTPSIHPSAHLLPLRSPLFSLFLHSSAQLSILLWIPFPVVVFGKEFIVCDSSPSCVMASMMLPVSCGIPPCAKQLHTQRHGHRNWKTFSSVMTICAFVRTVVRIRTANRILPDYCSSGLKSNGTAADGNISGIILL